ncbi:MAG: hypothetical protein J7M27_05365 [Candidatus Latescibacteria bacterium]|nr:hypothetical protein [Candidatus Latescibacterota bacterium]
MMAKRSRKRTEDYPPVPPTPKAYWEDRKWAYNHMDEIVKAYPNLWVAVVDKKVIASGKVIAEVERVAEESTGRKEFPVVLAERGIHVYTN